MPRKTENLDSCGFNLVTSSSAGQVERECFDLFEKGKIKELAALAGDHQDVFRLLVEKDMVTWAYYPDGHLYADNPLSLAQAPTCMRAQISVLAAEAGVSEGEMRQQLRGLVSSLTTPRTPKRKARLDLIREIRRDNPGLRRKEIQRKLDTLGQPISARALDYDLRVIRDEDSQAK